jgi:hypothetical protein
MRKREIKKIVKANAFLINKLGKNKLQHTKTNIPQLEKGTGNYYD